MILININVFISPHGLLHLMLLVIFVAGNDSNINIEHKTRVQCLHKERIALLKLKSELIDDNGRLSTWGNDKEDVGKDCCKWKGVICDNTTNHVVALDLQSPGKSWTSAYAPLRGKISASLVELNDLRYLDLSSNDFNGSQIFDSIYSLSKLQHLNLTSSNFGGLVPHRLGNLSMLRHLDLSWNTDLKVNDLDWLSGFHSLEYLDLGVVNLERASTWLQTISNLKSLKSLYLSACSLSETNSTTSPLSLSSINGSSPSLAILDLSSNNLKFTPTLSRFLNLSSCLSYIDFSMNNFDGKILEPLSHMMSLSHLDLSNNNLEGDFPQSFMNLFNLKFLNLAYNGLNGQFSYMMMLLRNSTKLEYLNFAENKLVGGNLKLEGSFPQSYTNLNFLDLTYNSLNSQFSDMMMLLENSTKLQNLYLDGNALGGSFPNMSRFSFLKELKLLNNALNGSLTEDNIRGLPHLKVLHLSENHFLTVRIKSSWNAPFQLDNLQLSSCNLGPDFPKWLRTQKELTVLHFCNAKIHDTVPYWFWNNFQMLNVLNMSYNQIHGVIPNLSSSVMFNLASIDLSYNLFNGSLPLLPQSVFRIDLSKNSFSGTIVHMCKGINSWGFLDLSNNVLFGELLRECFTNSPILSYLSLANNNFSGKLPSSIDSSCSLSSLHLQSNSFEGEIPTLLRGCVDLVVVDLGENKLTGKIPAWIGKSMPNLMVLSLRFNNFFGSLPLSLCHLTEIQVLDTSMNKFSGTIPKCLNNFSSMSIKPDSDAIDIFLSSSIYQFRESAQLIWKGIEAKYDSSLGLLKLIDFSSNNLVGQIPIEITGLVGLIALNLSRNNLVGPIPRDIGKLESLDFLDLSKNNLSGGIPSTLSQMNRLGVLDLSFNNLSGRIPWRNHLQTFSDSAFMGNLGLCGDPLQLKPCPEDLMPKKPMVKDDEDEDESSDNYISAGFYICVALGFITSFWAVSGTIFLNKPCKFMFFKMVTCVEDWLYVKILIKKNRIMRHFEN